MTHWKYSQLMPTLETPQETGPRFSRRSHDFEGSINLVEADDLRWQLALRIAASGSLGRSGLLSDFLLYIVDRSIRGLASEITEQRIGVVVFGRARDYDPNDDNIVRSYARKLRKRIDDYFAVEGSEETLRLDIPRGGYSPTFSECARNIEPGSPSDTREEIAPLDLTEAISANAGLPRKESRSFLCSRRLADKKSMLTTLLAVLAGLGLGIGLMLFRPARLPFVREEATTSLLWKQLFSSSRDTFVVPSDAGLVIMQRLVERPVPLTAYISGSYRTKLKAENLPDADEILKLSARRYTNVVDLDFATRLGQMREVVPERMMVRYARELRMDDLRTGNVILMGSDESNPWIQLFDSQLPLRFRYEADTDKPSGFVNLHPLTGEAAIYSTKGQEDRTYGIIAYLPNLADSGHVLIVAGLNTAGTQAAASYLMDSSLMKPALERARNPHGELQPFELLVSAGNVATNSLTPHLVIQRVGLR